MFYLLNPKEIFMKLKYKRLALLTTIATIGIGILVLSIIQERPKAEESLSSASQSVEDNESLASDTDNNQESEEEEVTPSPSPSPTPSPTPTPIPIHDLEEEGYPEIESLFKDYYVAKNKPDVGKIKSLLSDPSKAYTEDELIERTGFVEDYRNIKPYVKKGMYEGTYIAYVYSEIKITGINTPAPSLAKSYLITDENGELKIFSGDMDEELETYYMARNEDEDIKELIDKTNKAFEEAMNSDEDLYNFWEAIEIEESNSQDGDGGDDSDDSEGKDE